MKIFHDWTFTWWEAAIFKVCLISLGIMLGLYFRDALMPYMWLWRTLFVATAAYLVILFVRNA